MNTIPVPLDWLKRATKLFDDVRDVYFHRNPMPYRLNMQATILGAELVNIVADAQKEKKP